LSFLNANIHCFIEDLYDIGKKEKYFYNNDNGENNLTNVDFINSNNQENENPHYHGNAPILDDNKADVLYEKEKDIFKK